MQPGPTIQGLALARGGGLGPDVIGSSRKVVAALTAKGLPIYAALGHAVNIELLDRYADQVFHSPTALASAMHRSIQAASRRTWQAREVDRQKAVISERDRQLAARDAHAGELERSAKQADVALQARIGRWRTVAVILSLVTAAMFWLLIRHR